MITLIRTVAAQLLKEEAEHLRERADAKASGVLRDVFDGRPVVTHDSRTARNASPHVAIREALRHDYELVHDDGGVLTFKRS